MKYFERNKSYKYELASIVTQKVCFIPKDFKCRTDFINIQSGYITIRKRYAWDGSSIPGKKFLKAITFGKYDPDKYCKEASLVHDAFYQLMRLKKLSREHKDAIDSLYEKMCIAGGMSKRQAARRYWAVKTFGHRTLKPRFYPEKQILET
ncbi:hypothetical protein LCGC14_1972000 [marine sediment metagenome]|uniref:DUF1353 domain-containing protein n=1 Tax=marine sediment metagenome TaxID=412755 RepID=A0A0F9I8H4_9ZZZZ